MGSSPLARGLPLASWVRAQGPGIIPARAGFTEALLDPEQQYSDHPRSRGVYRLKMLLDKQKQGSSPLARGLLLGDPETWPEPGIIPARAGFTVSSSPGRSKKPDHPRSRGVYRQGDTAYLRGWGSSPLARGLLFRF